MDYQKLLFAAQVRQLVDERIVHMIGSDDPGSVRDYRDAHGQEIILAVVDEVEDFASQISNAKSQRAAETNNKLFESLG